MRRAPRAIGCLLLLLAPAHGLACRCAQQPGVEVLTPSSTVTCGLHIDADETVQLFAQPDTDSREAARVADYARLTHRELPHESTAAAVYARRYGWFGLRTTAGEPAWARASPQMRFVPYAELVIARLTYLTASWSGRLWPGPGRRSALPGRDGQPNAWYYSRGC